VAELDHLAGVMEQQPRPVDLVPHLTRPMPFATTARMMGAPREDWPRLQQLSTDVLAGPWSDPEQVAAADAELVDYLDRLLATKADAPSDDLFSVLVQAREGDDRLSHQEIVELAVLLLVAGHESTTTLLGHCILALLRQREQWDRLLAEPELVPAAAEELLRLQRRTEIGDAFARVAAEDVELGGVLVKAGDVVLPALDAADRDPEVFDRPDELDFERPANPHLVFGAGIHRCIGAQLALMETEEALRMLLRRFPTLRLACSPEELRLNPRLQIRALESLPVTW
jgi:cytochrome P450